MFRLHITKDFSSMRQYNIIKCNIEEQVSDASRSVKCNNKTTRQVIPRTSLLRRLRGGCKLSILIALITLSHADV